MSMTKPAGWTLNKTQLKARGWTPDDIASRLGKGRDIDWKGMPMPVWTLTEIEAAEAADQAFAARLAEASGRAAKRAADKEVRDKEIEAKERKNRQLSTWAQRLPERLAELERTCSELRYLLDCRRQRFEIRKHEPAKSTWYFPELASTNGHLVGSEVYPFLFDESKLFHVFSEGWAKSCKHQISWRVKDGPKAVAILVHVGISFSEELLERTYDGQAGFGSGGDKGGDQWFKIRVEHTVGYKLIEYGDCCQRKLLD